jgi:aspartyl-tRNA(Asn)/glutamyl-tRNA(Gln) amidotransferase subunit A
MNLVADPLAGITITEYGRRLRSGETTVVATVESYLRRIEQLDQRLGAYEFVASDAALTAAAALDAMLRAGIDLGPLMGVPVAVKDLLAVEGMPTRAGSNLDVSDIVGSEGSFIRSLKRKGAVILGKTKTVEFAFGAVGTNSVRGTPWNPHDGKTQRIPGGSSSGSAVAVAAGLCAYAIGTDTGGSVRLPAALCGIFGLKTTVGLWPVDGVFPLSPTLDSLGLLTRTARDASTIFHTIMDLPEAAPTPVSGLRFGKPTGYFYDGLDPAVASCTQTALDRLEAAGARLVEINVPEAAEREALFPVALPAELIETLGRDRFMKGRDRMDPVVAARAARGLDLHADQYIRLINRHRELIATGKARMAGLDGWITPTAALQAPPVADFDDLQKALGIAVSITKSSQPMNMFGQCGVSHPIQHFGSSLPVGLQIACSPNGEVELLAIARTVEDIIGTSPSPDLSAFINA